MKITRSDKDDNTCEECGKYLDDCCCSNDDWPERYDDDYSNVCEECNRHLEDCICDIDDDCIHCGLDPETCGCRDVRKGEESHEVVTPLPCPFCGGEVAPYELKDIPPGKSSRYYIRCWNDDCEVNPSIDRPSDSKEEIITKWNKRDAFQHLKYLRSKLHSRKKD